MGAVAAASLAGVRVLTFASAARDPAVVVLPGVGATLHAGAPVRTEGTMGTLIYAANISLDGFLEDGTGSFDWSVPDEDVHASWNESRPRARRSSGPSSRRRCVMGGGKPALPRCGRLDLELLDHRRLAHVRNPA